MKRKIISHIGLLSFLLFFSSSLFAMNAFGQDTCAINDLCETAIMLQNVNPDQGFFCLDGCNIDATADEFSTFCLPGSYPTVWYSLDIEGAKLLNIQVSSSNIRTPVIRLYRMVSGCSDKELLNVTQNYLDCVVGSEGTAEALGIQISLQGIYLIAVSSTNGQGGTFSLCVSTISEGSICVVDREIVVTARSDDGDLSGPFNPGETVSICMNVNSYSAQNNGCQWFQGLVPVFGNGWDPSSFDPNGQPLNATINGAAMGIPNNGLYGAATWDWFSDVDYHYSDSIRQIGDFDGNGTVDICSILYDPECPNIGGITGGCCGPCWGTPIGDFLPNGWFAYGINGTCATPGPPIGVDWGDGNTCGAGMGPWNFCFDLKVRNYPDCLQDTTRRDLSLSFFTFSDGETGAYTGITSPCALDQPSWLSLPFACPLYTDLGVERVEDRCAGDSFFYIIDEPGIRNWTWTIYPSWAVLNSAKAGDNGFAIEDGLFHPISSAVEVTYSFSGYEEGTSNIVVKEVRFKIIPGIKSALPDVIRACEKDKDSLIISALPLSGGLAPFSYLWNPGGETTSSITLSPPFQPSAYTLHIVDSIGCMYQKEIILKVHPCQLDSIMTDDESNDTQTDEDPPHGGGNLIKPGTAIITHAVPSGNMLKIFPQPTTDDIHIEWPKQSDDAKSLTVLDPRGYVLFQTAISKSEMNEHHMQVDVREYADGVYLIILHTRQSFLVGKFVKM